MVTRARVYVHAGYLPPSELDEPVARLAAAVGTEPTRMLADFVAGYA
ncbi:MAG: hypothetical protein JWR62_1935 [Modestobacter sp.]|nr:hypothetical protein [Modestobacter sp.]